MTRTATTICAMLLITTMFGCPEQSTSRDATTSASEQDGSAATDILLLDSTLTDIISDDGANGQDTTAQFDAANVPDILPTADGASVQDSSSTTDAGTTELLPPSQSPILTYCPFTDAADLNTFNGRRVVRICHTGDTRQGCHTDSIAAAIGMASSGDRIEIVNDDTPYTECAVIPSSLSNIEIVGVCGRPHLKDAVCNRKGLFLNEGSEITMTNLEISNLYIPASDGGNAAAIRDQSQGGLYLRYVYFHHNQNGILGGKGTITIDWSKFEANGSSEHAGYAHNIYLGSDVEEAIIRNSLFLRARHQGNNLKSRAQSMLFQCSVSASLDGIDSAEMDISEGGHLTIANSLIEQGPESVNSRLIGFAMEASNPDRRHPSQQLIIRDSVLINDKANGTFVAYGAYNDLTLSFSNVRFVGPGTGLNNVNGGNETMTENDIQTIADRVSAGFPAYSTDHRQLPTPPGCPNFEYF